MFENLANEFAIIIENAKIFLPLVLKAFGVLWAINITNWALLGSKLNVLGIIPRRVFALGGIIFAPILHTNFNHLFFNSIPLFALSLFMLQAGIEQFAIATSIIVLLNGLAIWLLGRPGIHVGASGVIAGYFGYVLASAYEYPTFSTLFLAFLALYYFGGILMSLLPTEDKVSWEGHLTGFLAGIAALLLIEYGYIYKFQNIFS